MLRQPHDDGLELWSSQGPLMPKAGMPVGAGRAMILPCSSPLTLRHFSSQLSGPPLPFEQMTMRSRRETSRTDELLPGDLLGFLACRTPDAWIDWALKNPQLLLIDHAQCEKKAASTAMSLLYRYVDQPLLLEKMSQLAREELLHFEQVVKLMEARGVVYHHLSASRYAGELRRHVRGRDPERLIDILIIGALIEARSCERFASLIPYLDAELAKFYRTLVKSEGRHYEDYLMLARHVASDSLSDRIAFFTEQEAILIASPDSAFRFHSGVPA